MVTILTLVGSLRAASLNRLAAVRGAFAALVAALDASPVVEA